MEEQSEQDRTRRSFLQSAIGLSVLSAGAIVYDRMERTPDWNSFNIKIGGTSRLLRLRGTVSVSMLSSEKDNFFPAEEIDLTNTTIRFAIYRGSFHPDDATLLKEGAAPLHGNGHVKDVNGDRIDDLTFHFDACEAFVEDEIFEGDMKGRLLIKEEWSFTEKKDGWKGDEPVRIVGGSCN